MVTRTWISPDGDPHDVSDEHLYQFCRARGLHYENMLDHITTATSDHKNDGWRLIERLQAIGHVKRPRDHVPALGTLDSFHKSCLSSSDGRAVLTNKNTLGKLLAGTYNGGKPWKQWEKRILSTAEMRETLRTWKSGGDGQPPSDLQPQPQLPDFAAGWMGAADTLFEMARADLPRASGYGCHGARLGAFEPHARARKPCTLFDPDPCP